MDNGFSFFGFAANSSSLNAFESVSRVIKVGPGQCMDTTLRLDSPGSSRKHISSPKGIKRKWGDNGTRGLDKKSSLALGLGHSPSSSDSKGSSATVCTLSSAKEMDEESSMDLNLNFHLHLGSENSPSSKKSTVPASKAFEMGSKYDLELSLSTRQSESDITSITPNSANCPDGVDASPTLDQGLPNWMLESTLSISGTGYGYETTSVKNDPSLMLSNISSTVISATKSSVTYTSGLSRPTQPQRSFSSKICQFNGCTKGARGASGLCIAHGGGRRCQRSGCQKGAEGRTVYCKAHGGGRRCQFLGCTKSAEGKTDLCIAHGGGRRCSHDGCTRAARGKSGLCIRHGGGKRCQFENCTKSAEGFSGLCISHGGGRRCQYPACTKGAQGSTMFCKAHGGGKRCTVLGCTKGAEGSTAFCKGHGGGKRCSFQGGGVCPKSVHGGTLYCVAHGGGKRCAVPDCTKSARGRTDYCVRHGGGKRCKHEGCGKSAQGSTDFCKAHGGGKRCTWGQRKSDVGGQQCDRFARGKTGLCAAHSALLQDRRVHGGGTVGAAIQNEQPGKSDKMKGVATEEMQVDALGGEKWNFDLNGSEHGVGRSGSAYFPIANASAARGAVSVSEGRVHGGGLMAALATGAGLQLEGGSSSSPCLPRN